MEIALQVAQSASQLIQFVVTLIGGGPVEAEALVGKTVKTLVRIRAPRGQGPTYRVWRKGILYGLLGLLPKGTTGIVDTAEQGLVGIRWELPTEPPVISAVNWFTKEEYKRYLQEIP